MSDAGKYSYADMSRAGLIDSSDPAIIVVDLRTGDTRRVLQCSDFFQPGPTPIIVEGQPLKMKDDSGIVHEIKLGLNPIAIDPTNEWVYFAAMTPGKLYRVPASILGDSNSSESNIEQAIEVYADKSSCDGIAAGDDGVVYITNIDKSEISIADKSGVRTWVKDPRLIWPNGVYIGPDGSLIVTPNQLNRAAAFNDGKSTVVKPYHILKITDN